MGISQGYANFLGDAIEGGAVLGKTLTVGRLNLFLRARDRRRVIERCGKERPDSYEGDDWIYAEKFLKMLGATDIESIDGSGYEDATIVHDLNLPVPDNLHGKFDTVCDGGTLEHIFFFPQALKNCMQMVKVGGNLFCASPANNLGGHGFYQLSPDLFFQALSPENGFEICQVVIQEKVYLGRSFSVQDTNALRARVEYQSNYVPLDILVWARKTRDVEVFSAPPVQADYKVAWDTASLEEIKPREFRGRSGWKSVLDHFEEILPGVFRRYHRGKGRILNEREFGLEKRQDRFRQIR